MMEKDRGITLLHYSSTPLSRALCLIAETLLMATLLHALAALVLGNFRFASFFERAHSDFQIREPGLNHLIRRLATPFFTTSLNTLATIEHRMPGAVEPLAAAIN